MKKKPVDVIQIAEKTIISFNMLKPYDSVLVALSGGPDSTALLNILIALSDKFKIKVAAAHLDHKIRKGRSEKEAEFAKKMAEDLGIKCIVESRDIPALSKKSRLSIERTARKERYEFLYKAAKNLECSKIATGHHKDDNAESVLMYMLRGSGLSGICGIRPVIKNKVNIIRPLTELNKELILNYLKALKITYMTDDSNADTSLARNSIRHKLIPFIKKHYNPEITDAIYRLSKTARSEESLIVSIAEKAFEESLIKQEPERLTISGIALNKMPNAIACRTIKTAIKHLSTDPGSISFSHIKACASLLKKNRGEPCSLDLPGRVRVSFIEQNLIFSHEKKNLRYVKPFKNIDIKEFSYKILEPCKVSIPEIDASITLSTDSMPKITDIEGDARTEFFDMEKLKFPLTIRNIRKGDKFCPLGMQGTQTLKKFFINRKISKETKAKTPVLISDGKIAWVVGQRIAQDFKLTDFTKKVIKASINFEKGEV